MRNVERILKMSVTVKSVSSKYNVSAMVVFLDSEGTCMTEDHTIKDSDTKGIRAIKKVITDWFKSTYDNCKLLGVENITYETVKTVSVYTFECDAEKLAELAEQDGITVSKESVVK